MDRGRLFAYGGSALAFILLVVASIVHLGVRSDLSETRTDLDQTQTELEATSADLRATEGDLETRTSELESMTGERDELEDRNASLERQLDGVQGTLNDARDQLGLQAGQISILKSCLNGVAIALNDVLDGYYAAAASALQSVQGPCNEAARLF